MSLSLPSLRVDAFTGVKPERNSEAYLPRCFVFLDGRLARLPTRPWATRARYTPGQVWYPPHVDRADVNPRPLSPLAPALVRFESDRAVEADA